MQRSVLSKSSLMAVALAAAVLAWMLTGIVGGSGAPATSEPGIDNASDTAASAGRADADRGPALRVSVRKLAAASIGREVVVSGRTEPSRTVEIKAETDGRVVALGAERGAAVAEGEPIASLDVRDRQAAIAEAEALIAQRRLEHEAATRLEGQQLVAQAQIAETRALLEAAEAQLVRRRLDLERTRVTAPFDGMLEERSVELGDYVGIGDPIAQVVDNDPLVAVGEVSERNIQTVKVGSRGTAELADGRIIEGSVRYVSPAADPTTRTFRIELAIPNADNRLPAGMTAELRLPAGETVAHFLSPALLTLDDDGNIGVKTVDAHDTVHFHEIEIVRSASDGVWVTGLPDEANVITVGQGFVAIGQVVEPVPAEAE